MPADRLDLLTDLALRLDRIAMPYMVTGSVAALFYGLDRSTQDTDVVIDIRPANAQRFVEAFDEAYFVDPQMVADSARTRIMFNVMPKQGGKVDLIPLKDDPFERLMFERRIRTAYRDGTVCIPTPQDLVLRKLVWAKDSRSDQQLKDVAVIMAGENFDELDNYFQRWLDSLGVRELLELARSRGHNA
jgi:hypothetical protein